jgi:hypothetical protein
MIFFLLVGVSVKHIFYIVLLLLCSFSALGETKAIDLGDDVKLRFSGYFDGYYSYDLAQPAYRPGPYIKSGTELGGGGKERTSNPLYDNQFSISYAYFQAQIETEHATFTFAPHIGDIVEKMYQGEPENTKHYREVSMAVPLNKKNILKVGYFPSLFGAEVFVNALNLNATRAQMTDFAPDYDAGVRLKHLIDSEQSLYVQITNGWQVNRDNNKDKALGVVYVKDVKNHYLFNWGQFLGNEANTGDPVSYRYFNNFFGRYYYKRWIFVPMVDIGWEQRHRAKDNKSIFVPWQAYGLSTRYAVTEKTGIALRIDSMYDPNNVIPELKNGKPHGWQHVGYTLTYEYIVSPQVLYRMEGRYIKTRERDFQAHRMGSFRSEDSFLYTSMSFMF